MQPLDAAFFRRDAPTVAEALLGCLLVHDDPAASGLASGNETRLALRIVETEAYTDDDPAMHGWKAVFDDEGRVQPTGRAADLFAAPGTAYVYRVYGHWLLNVVTDPEGAAGAVLIRAGEPVEGEEVMTARREAARRRRDLTNGPGKLTEALGIDGGHHGTNLTTPPLMFAQDDFDRSAAGWQIETSSRIGLSRGVNRMHRWLVASHPFVSPAVPSDIRVARKTRRVS